MKLYKEDSEFAKSPITIIAESIIIFILMSLFVFMVNSKKNTSYKNENFGLKACKANIRLLTSAIEKYNNDTNNSMHTLDQFKLLEGEYLKKIIIKEPDNACYYFSNGDLTEDGNVYCEFHGDIEGTIIDQNCSQQKDSYIKYLDEKELKRIIIFYILIIYVFTFPLYHLFIHMRFKFKPILGLIMGISQAMLFFLLLFSYKFYCN